MIRCEYCDLKNFGNASLCALCGAPLAVESDALSNVGSVV